MARSIWLLRTMMTENISGKEYMIAKKILSLGLPAIKKSMGWSGDLENSEMLLWA